jgi:hypothetical protein
MHPRPASLIVAEPVHTPFLFDAYERGFLEIIWRPFDYTQAIHTADQAARDRAIRLANSTSNG